MPHYRDGRNAPQINVSLPNTPKGTEQPETSQTYVFFAQREVFWIQSSSAVCLYAGGRHQDLILESICSNAYLTISHTNCWDCPWAINKKTTIRVITTSRSVIPYRVTNGFLPFISSSTSGQCLCVLFILIDFNHYFYLYEFFSRDNKSWLIWCFTSS